jgi:hypothetical protein
MHREDGKENQKPRRPVEKIGKDLGVTAVQFKKCFENLNPAPKEHSQPEKGNMPIKLFFYHAYKKQTQVLQMIY